VTRLLAGIFAGGITTRLLEPQNHKESDSELDYEMANAVLNNAVEASHRDLGEQNALRMALAVVNRHSKLIMSVRDALVSAYGFLDGERATELFSGLEGYGMSGDSSS